jgi:hypothetical protein
MTVIDEIREAWGWVGLSPEDVVGENDFGNLMIKDSEGRYWRLCPEDLYCTLVAANREELKALSQDQEFLRDWYMPALVNEAVTKCGALEEGKKYCLKIPGPLGGEYGGDNLATISLLELIRASGHIAREIRDLPDGAQVRLKVVD